MKKLRWQIIIAIVALIAIAVLLLGQQPVLQTVLPQPSTGGVYIEGIVGEPVRFNPLLDFYNQTDRDVDRLLYSGLIKFDAWGNPISDLAEAWGVSVDGTVFNVTLRANAVWHDGMPVTTADVLFTIELMRAGELPIPADLVALWNALEVVVFDEHNMQFRLTEPYAPFVDYLAFGIVPQHLLQGKTGQAMIDDAFNLAPVGSGPYKFVELLVEDGRIAGVVLDAFDDYYFERPFIDQIVVRFFETTADALAAYQNGEILGISPVQGNDLDAVLAEEGLNMYSARLPQLSLVMFNLNHAAMPFFEDVEVRKALMIALNRPWMIDQVLGGQAMVADTPIFPGTWAYYEGVDVYQYDPEAAIEILRAAGYAIPAEGGEVRAKDGVPLRFDLVHLDTPTHAQLARMIRDYWAAIGVRVKLVAVEMDVLLNEYLEPRDYQAALVDLTLARTPDPDPYPFWHQSQAAAGQNYSQWNDRRASEYLEAARVTVNQQERIRLYRNFQVHFSRELPALPLYFPIYNYAVDAEMQGVSIGPVFDPSDRFTSAYRWFLVARPQIQDVEAETETP